jgi:hypothetical protein
MNLRDIGTLNLKRVYWHTRYRIPKPASGEGGPGSYRTSGSNNYAS